MHVYSTQFEFDFAQYHSIRIQDTWVLPFVMPFAHFDAPEALAALSAGVSFFIGMNIIVPLTNDQRMF